MIKLRDIIRLDEVTYRSFKNETSTASSSQQLNKAVKSIKNKIKEIDTLVSYTERLKDELKENGEIKVWRNTNEHLLKIQEMMTIIQKKIKKITK